jgi:hypothetical protein
VRTQDFESSASAIPPLWQQFGLGRSTKFLGLEFRKFRETKCNETHCESASPMPDFPFVFCFPKELVQFLDSPAIKSRPISPKSARSATRATAHGVCLLRYPRPPFWFSGFRSLSPWRIGLVPSFGVNVDHNPTRKRGISQ